jgi:vancomycin resistance protein YoaR
MTITVYRADLKRRSRLWRMLALAVVVAAGAILGAGAYLARAAPNRLPPAVSIAGVDVGGLSLEDARARLERRAEELEADPIVLAAGATEIETTGAELGAEPQIDQALAQAAGSRDSWSRLSARLGAADRIEIELAFEPDGAQLDRVLARVATKLEQQMVPASVELRGDEVVVTPARAGIELDRESAAKALALLPDRVELSLHEVPPSIPTEAAVTAKSQADRLLTSPPLVVYERTRFEPPAEVIRRALRFEPLTGAIAVSLDPDVLDRPLRRAFHRYEREPTDARFRVRGKRVRIVPSEPGLELATARVTAAIAASNGAPEVEAVFTNQAADLTTREANGLGVRELVSEFTTPYPCCAPRVTNIQLAAGILDGTIIRAGQRFSLNEAMGPRTSERGFVLAPMIEAGRLRDAVGGGVSQVATTFYNAAFFAGLELIAHTPHQFYISRYPMGREATVSWGGPELIFRNDWRAAILVKVAAGDTSITVRFYSSKLGRRVETQTGEPYSYTSARVIRVKNPDLAPGSEVVVQSGGVSGFSVDYTRKVFQGDRLRRNERFHVRYSPEDTIVEVGPPGEEEQTGEDGASPGAEEPAEGSGAGGETEPPPADTPPAEEPPPAEAPPAEEPPAEEPAEPPPPPPS